MRTLLSRLGGLAMGLLVVAGVARADEPVTLKYKWTKGETIAYRMTQNTKTKMTGTPMGDMEGTQKQVMISRMEVKDVGEDGAATLVVHFDSVKVDMDQPGMGKMSYDSEAPAAEGAAANPFAASFGALIGESMTFVVEPTGAVRSATGMEKIMKKMIDAMDKENPGMGAMVAQQLKGTFSDDSMRRTYEQALRFLPGKPVSTGDSWDLGMEQPVPMLGTMKIASTNTFQGLEKADGRNLAKIATSMKITLEPAADGGGMNMTATTNDAKGSGVNLFDVDRGQLHRGTGTLVMPMTISVSQGEQKMTMNQTVNADTLIERIENYTPPTKKPAAAAPPAPAKEGAK